jgi:hypothetical protein
MIKVFCNKCGKEITGNINTVTEKTQAIDCCDNVVAKWQTTVHYCDECQYNELTCGFKVGDIVITDDGRSGVIEDICDCDHCKKRGFYEPRVKMTIGNDQIWITDTDKKNGFISFYQIGGQVFGNIDEEAAKRIRQRIVDLKHELIESESQLDMLLGLTMKKKITSHI